jgi:threonine dehydrogenase-like Zn-dependent dehydrogenase
VSATYDALVRDGRRLQVRRCTLPPGQLPIRVLLAGVCGTDLQILRQVRPDPARVLGHEGLGHLPSEDGGTRPIVFNPVDPLHQDTILGHNCDGIFRRVLPPGTPTRTFEVRPELAADLAVLVEPLAAVLYGWSLMNQAVTVDRLAVWGSGTAAVLNAIVAELAGATVQLHVDRPARRNYLTELNVLGTTPQQLGQQVPAGSAEVDAAVLCTPRETAGAALGRAVRSVRPGGVIDLFGGLTGGDTHPALPGIDLGAVRRTNVCGAPACGHVVRTRTDLGTEIVLTGHRGTSDSHFADAQQLLLQHPERFGKVISDVVSLVAAATLLPRLATATAAERDDRPHLKIVVDMSLPSGARRADLSRPAAEAGP